MGVGNRSCYNGEYMDTAVVNLKELLKTLALVINSSAVNSACYDCVIEGREKWESIYEDITEDGVAKMQEAFEDASIVKVDTLEFNLWDQINAITRDISILGGLCDSEWKDLIKYIASKHARVIDGKADDHGTLVADNSTTDLIVSKQWLLTILLMELVYVELNKLLPA